MNISYTRISPNKNLRTKPITKITVHHCAGPLAVETIGNMFANSAAQVSCNYVIGYDGRVGLIVPENYRSWCSKNEDNDQRAITIEVANDGGSPNWHVSQNNLDVLVELCTDICQCNSIPRLDYTGDAKGTLTTHNMFTPTICPGPFLESKLSWLVEQVNKRLGATTSPKATVTWSTGQYRLLDPPVNIRERPDINSKAVGRINEKNVYTLVEFLKGPGAIMWGKLKSGTGWVSMDFWEKRG